MQKRMKAAKAFRYGTRMLQAGDEFEAPRQDARVLSALGHASEVRPAPEPESDAEAKPKRRARKAKSDD